jgi:hypothetical protein
MLEAAEMLQLIVTEFVFRGCLDPTYTTSAEFVPRMAREAVLCIETSELAGRSQRHTSIADRVMGVDCTRIH